MSPAVGYPWHFPPAIDTQVFEAAHPFHFKLPDEQWLMRSPLLPHVHYYFLHLISVEGEVVVRAPCHGTGHLPPVGCFVAASDASYHCGVIRKLQDDVVLMGGDTVVGEQGVEGWAEDASLWGASVCDGAG